MNSTMNDNAAALRQLDYLIWTIMALMAAIMTASVLVSDFVIAWASFVAPTGVALLLVAGGWFYTHWREDLRLASGLISTAQLIIFTAVGAPLSYIAAAANFPLQDHAYDTIDRAMGLDWRAILAWMNAHTAAHSTFALAYMSFTVQAMTTVLALAFLGQIVQLRSFVLAFAISALVCIAVSAIVPAQGAWGFYNITAADHPAILPVTVELHLPTFNGLRDGTLRTLSIVSPQGIITFPSFHAALGVIFMVALWPVPIVRWAAILVNGLMILATPIDGGHYFIDVIVGIAVAVLALFAARATVAKACGPALARAREIPQLVGGE